MKGYNFRGSILRGQPGGKYLRQYKETSETALGETPQEDGSEKDNMRGHFKGTILKNAASGNILGGSEHCQGRNPGIVSILG